MSERNYETHPLTPDEIRELSREINAKAERISDWVDEQMDRHTDHPAIQGATPIQLRRLRLILAEAARYAFGGSTSSYEMKRFELEQTNGRLRVLVKVGLEGDEGTMGGLFRVLQQFWIGRRGGLSWYAHGSGAKRRGTRRIFVAFNSMD